MQPVICLKCKHIGSKDTGFFSVIPPGPLAVAAQHHDACMMHASLSARGDTVVTIWEIMDDLTSHIRLRYMQVFCHRLDLRNVMVLMSIVCRSICGKLPFRLCWRPGATANSYLLHMQWIGDDHILMPCFSTYNIYRLEPHYGFDCHWEICRSSIFIIDFRVTSQR